MNEPTRVGDLVTKFVQVYRVPKKCYECGTEWDGNSFAPQPENAPRLPGICAACIAQGEERFRELSRPVVESPVADMELSPPRPVGDDFEFPDRKRLASGEAA